MNKNITDNDQKITEAFDEVVEYRFYTDKEVREAREHFKMGYIPGYAHGVKSVQDEVSHLVEVADIRQGLINELQQQLHDMSVKYDDLKKLHDKTCSDLSKAVWCCKHFKEFYDLGEYGYGYHWKFLAEINSQTGEIEDK
jgi:hypothetical protein